MRNAIFPFGHQKAVCVRKVPLNNNNHDNDKKVNMIENGARNEDWVEYLNQLRDGVLAAYTGIIHGFRESKKLDLFRPHVNTVLDFIQVQYRP